MLYKQPQGGPLRIDSDSPLGRGAQVVIVGGASVDIVSSSILTAVGPRARATTGAGIAESFRKNSYRMTGMQPAIGTADFVEFWYGIPRSFGASGSASEAAFVTGSSTNQTGIALNLRSGNPNWGVILDWGTAAFEDSGQVLTLDVPTFLLLARYQNRTELWRDGKLVATFTHGPISYPASKFIIGSFIEDTGYWASSSDTILAGRFIASWPTATIRDFFANPWRIIADDEDDYDFTPLGAGGSDGVANPAGLAAVAAVGASTPTGGATALPSGVGSTTNVGTAQASGAASAAPTGIASVASVGVPGASAGAKAAPIGVGAAAAVGSSNATAGASAAPSGVSATASVGTAAATGAGAGTANPVGVAASTSVGSITATAGAKAAPAGVSALASVGTVTATGAGAGVASPAGVTATAAVGAVQVTGGARAAPAGVATLASVGVVSATGGASVSGTASPAGINSAATVGTPAASGGAGASPAGVVVTVSLGQVIASGTIIIGSVARPAGVTAYALAGTAIATGGGVINYARAPSGAGFTPQQREQAARPAQVGSVRPANTQGSTR